jgi:hypothetical protein
MKKTSRRKILQNTMAIANKTVYQVAVWKNIELQKYCVSFVIAAVNLFDHGVYYVGSDDVKEEHQPESHSIPGAAIATLRAAHVIEDCFDTIHDKKVFNGRRMSKRGKANGRKISLYKITSRSLAVEFLGRNGISVAEEPIQLELALF